MLRNAKALERYKVVGTDGEIGQVDQLYFDVKDWTIRYLVLDTGGRLKSRKTLVAPMAIQQVDRENEVFQVDLSRDQVEQSPEIDTHEPMTRQFETQYRDFFGWPAYWIGASPLAATAGSGTATAAGISGPQVPFIPINEEYGDLGTLNIAPKIEKTEAEKEKEDIADHDEADLLSEEEEKEVPVDEPGDASYLRNTHEMKGFALRTNDDRDIAEVRDFLFDEDSWAIHYMVLYSEDILPRETFILSPHWIDWINWAESEMHIDVPAHTIKNAPVHDWSQPLTRDYEQKLYEHYRREHGHKENQE